MSSLQSSQTRGSGFIPSHHSSPALAQHGSSVSESISSNSELTWNPTRADSEMPFVPDVNTGVEFFQSTTTNDIGIENVWNLVEERKMEDRSLRTEFGWESQSGMTESQFSQQQRCQSRDAFSATFNHNLNERNTSYFSEGTQHMNFLEDCLESTAADNLLASSRMGAKEALYKGHSSFEIESSSRLDFVQEQNERPNSSEQTQREQPEVDPEEENDGIPWF